MKKRRLTAIFLICFLLSVMVVLGINFFVILSQQEKILTSEQASEAGDASYIMVLGCGVIDGEASDMLEDRLMKGLETAEKLPESKLFLTGNNSGEQYNEVGVMKKFCIEKGFPEERIITDDYGFSTGESITNFYNDIKEEKLIIVTQKYHIYRALHIASQYDIDAVGVASDQRNYEMQLYYSLREVAARNKDFFKFLFV